MKRFASILKRDRASSPNVGNDLPTAVGEDTPEAVCVRGVRLFCESGGPNNSGEEVLHLPGIVESAESSPGAAAAAARVIRKFLSTSNSSRAYVQYNAIMLMRILTDNPGPSFTRGVDSKFVSTVNKLLRDGEDMSVQQILRETLDYLQTKKEQDENLNPLLTMWKDYKAKMAKKVGFNPAMVGFSPNVNAIAFTRAGTKNSMLIIGQGAAGSGTPNQPFVNPHNRRSSSHRHGGLPPPHELASRIEEARTSAKLLTQVVQSTSTEEVLHNDLLKEFVTRCQSASRSIQGYINAQDPPPDEDTLLTLIETNDQLSAALSRHQRAILQARKAASQASNAGGVLQQQPQQEQQQQPQSNGPQITPGTGAQLAETSSQPASQAEQTGYVAPSGPPPQLSMPKPQERLENPFDDSNKVPEANNSNGVGPNKAAEQIAQKGPEDEAESPAQQRKYRF